MDQTPQMAPLFSAHYSSNDSNQRAPASTLRSTLLPLTATSLPNANDPSQANTSLPFVPNTTPQYAYAHRPGSLALPSTYTTQQLHPTHTFAYQSAPTFSQSFAQPTNSCSSAVCLPSFTIPSERAQNTDWYWSAPEPATLENTMYSGSQYAAYDMPPDPQDFADVVDAMMSPRSAQYSHSYHQAPHPFPYDRPSLPLPNQHLVTGQHGSLPGPQDNAPSYHNPENSHPLICDICDKGPFGRIYELRRHKATVHAPPTQNFLCEFCQSPFKREDIRKRHVRTQHEGK